MPPPLQFLYKPSPRDLVSTQWGPKYTRITKADTAVSVVVGSNTAIPWPIVPADLLEWPQNIFVTANPGAGQTCLRLAVAMTYGVGVGQNVELGSVEGGAADEILSLVINPEICLVGSVHFLVASADYDAGIAGNDVTLNVGSIITPRGNVSLY